MVLNGYKIKTKTGFEEYDFEFATNPTILCGWDIDNDISIIDGSYNGLTRVMYGTYAPFSDTNTIINMECK